MLTCKQVSEALEQGDYALLPWFPRLSLKLHVALCIVCHRYNKQRMQFHDLFRKLRAREDQGEALPGVKLGGEARQRMADALNSRAHD